ncbi:flagellar filament capping protein FliD [Paenibacillus physcomitrellae]|uniref:Flagellar hook-associated protein 2 n=1 Tax=Paenibacillus physcomitrellae TaxID=1619311 RepID=A0ABQ1GGY2_9BACL|nr:flagellar filament capping protein FliD [Paenibacillus physcomitrellae]GGA43633.1 flagellar hook-associated protein 2 [Paenibacillus physcomitrellae]
MSTNLRIGGLASGMDTDTIVKQLMTAARAPLDKLNQQKQVLEWTREDYRTINSKLVDFRNNKVLTYDKSSSMLAQKAVITGNTTSISAQATSSANQISMDVVVKSLATKTTAQSKGSLGSDVTPQTTLADLAKQQGTADEDIPDTYTVTINKATITLNKTDSLSSVVTKINSNKDANVNAVFDEVAGKLSISSKTFGATDLSIDSDSSSNSLTALLGGFTEPEKGMKASVEVNGKSYTPDSNSLTLNGVEISLLSVTPEGEKSTISNQPDSSKALETIKAFVQNYNDLLDTLNKKVSEEKYRDYPPLTDDQKKELTDDDITAWTDKAKSGTLKNDEILKSAISSMRDAITKAIGSSGVFNLTDVGITTGQWYEGGKLTLDEDKFKSAIESNPQGVTDLFQGSSTQPGLFDQMADSLNGVLDKLASKAGTSKYSADLTAAFKTESTMGKSLKDYEQRISDLQDRLDDMENRYYSQFTAMEQAISKYNSQSSYLAGFVQS